MTWRERPAPALLRLTAWILPRDAREDVVGDLLEQWTGTVRFRTRTARALWLLGQPVIAIALRVRFRSDSAPRRHLFGADASILGASWLDAKIGFRMLRKQPMLTVVGGIAIAVGIPVGLFPGHLQRSFMQPIPVDGGADIRMIRYLAPGRPAQSLSMVDFERFAEELPSFESLAASTRGGYQNLIASDGSAAPVRTAEVSGAFFGILRTPPLLGRPLGPADALPGAAPVAVLGHETWRVRFASDPGVIGTSVQIGGATHTVIGVMPEGFRYPYLEDLWIPLHTAGFVDDAPGSLRGGHIVFGRLAEGASTETAEAELRTVHARMAVEDPETYEALRPEVVGYTVGLFGSPRDGFGSDPDFVFVQIMFVLILVVACLNVSMLTLARTAVRASELAVRTAFGAGRSRIVLQLFVESLVLAGLATGVGLLLADNVVVPTANVWLFDDYLPAWYDFGVTGTSAAWAAGLACLCAALVGIIPALKATGSGIHRNIQRANAARSGIRFGGLSSALIVLDVAVAMIILSFGGAIVGETVLTSIRRAHIQSERYLYAQLDVPRSPVAEAGVAVEEAEYRRRLGDTQRELMRRLEAEPDVGRVASGSSIILTDDAGTRLEIEDQEAPDGTTLGRASRVSVDPGFFSAIGQPVRLGRDFSLSDGEGEARVAIVNRTFVERTLGGRNAIGRRVRFTDSRGDNPGPWHQVVGVVDDIDASPEEASSNRVVYVAAAAGDFAPVALAIRTDGDPEAFTARLRQIAREVDPAATIRDTGRLDRVVRRGRAALASAIGGTGFLFLVMLGLSASGIYALLSLAVTQRTREIGIRSALGAGVRSIVRTVVSRAMLQLGLGVLLGLPLAAYLISEVAPSLLGRGITAVIGSTVLAAAGLVVLIGVLACTAPTMRALRISPEEALREG